MNYRTLPRGYRHVEYMDFVRNRKQLLTVNLSALGATALLIVLGLMTHSIRDAWRAMNERWWLWFVLAGMLIAYIPLHELTHGAFMYALSRVKPRYGIKLAYAYAGSTVWFDRKSHILIALAPVVIWGIALQALIAALPEQPWFWMLWAVQISNLSGSAGDIYCVVHLIRLKGDLLIQDTGTRMHIMRKTTPIEENKR